MDVDLNFRRGAEVDFKVNIPERRLTSKVSGEVMWVKPMGKRYQLGIRIKTMDKVTKSELLDLGYKKWRDTTDDEDRKK
jgi:Tfp pilus assembly protein PilZ